VVMALKNFHLVSDGVNIYPGLRTRIATNRVVEYQLKYEDVNTIMGQHPLEQVALRVYGDSRFWFVIADVNPLRRPQSWSVGEKIRIPIDFPMTLVRAAQR
jgi:hypothetical protein